jgi:hypothetical protein
MVKNIHHSLLERRNTANRHEGNPTPGSDDRSRHQSCSDTKTECLGEKGVGDAPQAIYRIDASEVASRVQLTVKTTAVEQPISSPSSRPETRMLA